MRTTDPLRKIHGNHCRLRIAVTVERSNIVVCRLPYFVALIPIYAGAMICMLRQIYVVCAQCHSLGKDTADIVKVRGERVRPFIACQRLRR
jgi:hypothetical protein